MFWLRKGRIRFIELRNIKAENSDGVEPALLAHESQLLNFKKLCELVVKCGHFEKLYKHDVRVIHTGSLLCKVLICANFSSHSLVK